MSILISGRLWVAAALARITDRAAAPRAAFFRNSRRDSFCIFSSSWDKMTINTHSPWPVTDTHSLFPAIFVASAFTVDAPSIKRALTPNVAPTNLQSKIIVKVNDYQWKCGLACCLQRRVKTCYKSVASSFSYFSTQPSAEFGYRVKEIFPPFSLIGNRLRDHRSDLLR